MIADNEDLRERMTDAPGGGGTDKLTDPKIMAKLQGLWSQHKESKPNESLAMLKARNTAIRMSKGVAPRGDGAGKDADEDAAILEAERRLAELKARREARKVAPRRPDDPGVAEVQTHSPTKRRAKRRRRKARAKKPIRESRTMQEEV